jgi:hypothetical protein
VTGHTNVMMINVTILNLAGTRYGCAIGVYWNRAVKTGCIPYVDPVAYIIGAQRKYVY